MPQGDITDDPAMLVAAAADQADEKHAQQANSSLGSEFVAEEGFEAPTEHELQTLRRVSAKIPLKAYTVGYAELIERLSYYGVVNIFVNYIQFPRPGTSTGRAFNPKDEDSQPGFLGMGQRASTGLTTFNQFWVYLIPLFGAYVADTYWGRFKTIWIAVIVTIIGHAILTASAAPSLIDHSHGGSVALFIIGLIIMGVGTGAFKPNISPLIAEQIPQQRIHVITNKKGERVIVDPVVTLSRVYNWFYMFINVGALTGQLTMAYAERYVGFYLAFLLPTIAFCTAIPVLYFGRNIYAHVEPKGSVLGPALRLVVLGSKGRIHLNPVRTYKHLTDGTFWTSVKPSNFSPETRPRWMEFDDAWVSEVARGLSACKVFAFLPLYWLTYNQINNNLVSQAATMSLHGVPNDVISNLDPFALMIMIPFCDFILYPFLRKRGINFSPIKRICAGFIVGSMAMIWATVIQYKIYTSTPCGRHISTKGCPKSPLNVWAQTGSYVLIALSEIFASITSLEYAFSKAPKNMRSMVQAVALFATAISAAIGQAFVSVSADPLLEWNYGSMAVISFITGVVFWICFRHLDKEEDHLNALPEGHIEHSGRHNDAEARIASIAEGDGTTHHGIASEKA